MEALVKKKENFQKKKNGFQVLNGNNKATTESRTDSSAESGEASSSRSSTEVSTEDVKAKGSSSPPHLGWPIRRADVGKSSAAETSEDGKKAQVNDSKIHDSGSKISGKF